jgi:hypothetical protein
MSFWEAYIEGKHPWAGNQVGWKKQISKRISITAYHFWIDVMFFFFLTLPLVIYGWDLKLLGIIISASFIGFIIEDFCWFIINPYYSLKKFNKKDVYWYPWFKFGKIQIPVGYVIGIIISVLSWYFLWK